MAMVPSVSNFSERYKCQSKNQHPLKKGKRKRKDMGETLTWFMCEHFSDTGLYAKPIKFTRSIPTMPITKMVLIKNCTTNDYYHMKI